MHESHLIELIIKGISENAQKEEAKSVSKIRPKAGAITGVKEDSFQEDLRKFSDRDHLR